MGDPVGESRIRKLGAVGFDLDEGEPGEEGEEVDEIGLLKKWFTPSDDESRAIVLENRFCQVFWGKFKKLICFGEFLSVLMFPGRVFPIPGVRSVAPMTVKIAEGEAQEDGGCSQRRAFALQGVKDLGRSIGKAGDFHGVRLKESVSLEKPAE